MQTLQSRLKQTHFIGTLENICRSSVEINKLDDANHYFDTEKLPQQRLDYKQNHKLSDGRDLGFFSSCGEAKPVRLREFQ